MPTLFVATRQTGRDVAFTVDHGTAADRFMTALLELESRGVIEGFASFELRASVAELGAANAVGVAESLAAGFELGSAHKAAIIASQISNFGS